MRAKRLWATLVCVVVVGSLVFTGTTPALADSDYVGGGTVAGEVRITSPAGGIPAPPACVVTTHTFVDTVIVGAIEHKTAIQEGYAGPFDVTEAGGVGINGEPYCENLDGTFETTDVPLGGVCAPGIPGCGDGAITSVWAGFHLNITIGGQTVQVWVDCKFTGRFRRLGPHVSVRLAGSCTVDRWVGPVHYTASGNVHVAVEAEFVPTGFGPGIPPGVTEARFAGTFVVTDCDLPFSIFPTEPPWAPNPHPCP